MPARKPNLASAAVELGFVVAAFACGLFYAPVWVSGLVAFAMLAYWSWTRRVQLNRLRGWKWARQSLIAVAAISVALAGAYGLGLLFRSWLS